MVSAGSLGGSERISFGGLASGIDTNSIIEQLMAVGQRPINAAANRRDLYQMRIDALSSLNSALGQMLANTEPLRDTQTFGRRGTTVLAQTGDADKVSVSATNGAALQNFNVEVASLATQTTATSDAPVGAAVGAAVPLDEAGLRAPFVPGTFSIDGTVFTVPAATASSVASAGSVGAAFDPAATLDDAGLTVTPSTGSFTVNGVSIAFDAAVDSLEDVIGRIDASEVGVTATYDEAAQRLTLTAKESGPALITLADADGGNFLEAMGLVDGGGSVVGAETAGTDLISLDDVVAMINGAGIDVTATVEDDAFGRANLLQLTSGSDIQLGSGADTSNFLALANLLESPGGATRTSAQGLGGLQQTTDLQDARLATPLSESSGSFQVNGVEIAWDATRDSIQNVITRINSSGASVTATYDAFHDRLRLTANATGSSAIAMEDVEGNLLGALGVLDATQELGENASYRIDGGALRYSTTNTITDAVPGVTITASDTTDEAVKVSINLASKDITGAVTSFVESYNETLGALRTLTRYDPDGDNGILFGDPTVQRIEMALRSALSAPVEGMPAGLRSLADVGLTFGAVGSAVGTTEDLVLDPAALEARLDSDPEAVAQLFTAFAASASLEADGTGSLASISGTPTEATKAGRYTIVSDASGNLQATFQAVDGSAPLITTGSIAAGGSNTTLIPGVTLTAKALLEAGSDVVTIGATQQGFGKTLHEYIASVSRTGGLLSNRTEEMQNTVSDMGQQIDRMNARLLAREEQLMRQFAAMEQAISRMQSQSQALTAMQSQLGNMDNS
ncbi:MAG: flagellar filament capping protein FliD [Dehalococcoidia bacterium]